MEMVKRFGKTWVLVARPASVAQMDVNGIEHTEESGPGLDGAVELVGNEVEAGICRERRSRAFQRGKGSRASKRAEMRSACIGGFAEVKLVGSGERGDAVGDDAETVENKGKRISSSQEQERGVERKVLTFPASVAILALISLMISCAKISASLQRLLDMISRRRKQV